MNDVTQSLLAKNNFEKWMITATVMLVAIIEVLDMTIVNVALAPMMGSLGANQEQITWVLTSYIVSSAIFMLLSGFLVDRFGQKRLLLYSILGFMVASMLCGLSTSLPEIVLFRTLQGIFGAALVPLSQTILRTTFRPEEYGKAMAIWGVGIMVAPVLGPTLGGYITEYSNWRWVFYINVPVCLFAFFMALQFVKETPKVKTPIDWMGMTLMAIGVGALQIFLDRGNSANWFQSTEIQILAFTAIVFLTWFIWRGLKIKEKNIIDFNIFKDRNFSSSVLMMTLFCTSVLGIISIQPLLLENFLGYPTETTGLLMAPRGIAAAVGMMLVSGMITKIDPRKIMFLGIVFTFIGSYMMIGYNLQTSDFYWIWSGAIQGFGMGLYFVPLATLSLATLPQKYIASGSGLFSFGRNIGISVGISLLSTLVTRESQINWNQLGSHINSFNVNLTYWLNARSWHLHDPIALFTLSKQLSLQAGMIAFIDAFMVVAYSMLLLIPLLFLIKKPKNLSSMMMH